MGLLEKAQQRKQMLVETEDTITPTIVEKEETDKAKPVGLLEKAQQRKQSLKQTSGTEKQEGMYTGLKQQTGGKQDIIENRLWVERAWNQKDCF
jgi:hypothetical protein